MGFRVNEIFLTLQGEGAQAGRKAVFCRFSGCNLWNGYEEDRAQAICWFCDTQFVGTSGTLGGLYKSERELSIAIDNVWKGPESERFLVFTGGEPALQLSSSLIEAVHLNGFQVAVETNGTRLLPADVDWITVSPKPKTELVQRRGNELKLVYPGVRNPEEFSSLDFRYFYLSPMWSPERHRLCRNIEAAMEYCAKNPPWRLTLQLQKILGIP